VYQFPFPGTLFLDFRLDLGERHRKAFLKKVARHLAARFIGLPPVQPLRRTVPVDDTIL
jgi:hypothetical protein